MAAIKDKDSSFKDYRQLELNDTVSVWEHFVTGLFYSLHNIRLVVDLL